ncbi:MAG: hypothetical protein Q7S02_01925 [bacterium]|nr:hypothetical protein [bacterium]
MRTDESREVDAHVVTVQAATLNRLTRMAKKKKVAKKKTKKAGKKRRR